MPKKGGLDRVVDCPFRFISTLSGATLSTQFMETDLVLANLGARAVAVGSAFEWFRFKSLSAYGYTTYGSGTVTVAGSAREGALTGSHAISWVDSNAALTGIATSLVQMAQYEKFRTGNFYHKLILRMSRSELAGMPYKWFSTSSSGAASDETSPGLFVQSIAIDNTIDSDPPKQVLVVEGVLQFRGMITPALTFSSALDGKTEVDEDDSSEVGFTSVPASVAPDLAPLVLRNASKVPLGLQPPSLRRSK